MSTVQVCQWYCMTIRNDRVPSNSGSLWSYTKSGTRVGIRLPAEGPTATLEKSAT